MFPETAIVNPGFGDRNVKCALSCHIIGTSDWQNDQTKQGVHLMEFSPYLIPGAATMSVLAIVYLVFVFWARRPGRRLKEVIRLQLELQRRQLCNRTDRA